MVFWPFQSVFLWPHVYVGTATSIVSCIPAVNDGEGRSVVPEKQKYKLLFFLLLYKKK